MNKNTAEKRPKDMPEIKNGKYSGKMLRASE